jgi:hypothetical protein
MHLVNTAMVGVPGDYFNNFIIELGKHEYETKDYLLEFGVSSFEGEYFQVDDILEQEIIRDLNPNML